MLSNLSLSQIARTPSESVRPGLWPVGGWHAILGRQSPDGTNLDLQTALYDSSGAKPALFSKDTISNGYEPIWALSEKGYVLQSTTSGARGGGLRCGDSPFISADQMTLEILFRLTSVGSDQVIATDGSAWNTATFRLALLGASSKLELRTRIGSGTNSQVSAVESAAISADIWYHIFGYRNGTEGKSRLYANNVETVSGTARVGLLNDTTNTPFVLFGTPNANGTIASAQMVAGGQIAFFRAYRKQLRISEMQELIADPLLPLRRKTFVSFYVPTGTPPSGFKPFWARNCNNLIGVA